jgi:hypothetical protein
VRGPKKSGGGGASNVEAIAPALLCLKKTDKEVVVQSIEKYPEWLSGLLKP